MRTRMDLLGAIFYNLLVLQAFLSNRSGIIEIQILTGPNIISPRVFLC